MSTITCVTICFLILAFISHGCYTVWKIKRHLHMLQLNSYFNRRYNVWLSKRKWQVFHIRELEPFIAFGILFFYRSFIVLLILFALIYWRLFLHLPYSREKKPLVFTPRIIRLFSTQLLFLLFVYGILVAVLWHKGSVLFMWSFSLLVLYNFFVPYIIMLGNFLLLPIERLIQYHYWQRARSCLRVFDNLKIIGITGSFGKTTTKYILAAILQHKFHTLKTPGSYNTPMGITKTVLQELKPLHEVFVVEMSARQKGDIGEICNLVQPHYGLITAIGEQHLETFGTLENVKNTKGELLKALPKDGVAFLNFDDMHCRALAATAPCRVVNYGIDVCDVDYQVLDLHIDERGSVLQVVRKQDGSRQTFHTPLLGRQNIYNVLGAIAVASELGISLAEMTYPLRQLAPIPHRLELKRAGEGVIFIDDAYNANPVGCNMALEVLAQITGKRKIVVTPGMIELGSKENDYNQLFGEQIAAVCDYVILVGKEQTLAVQHGLQAKHYPGKQLYIAKDFAAAQKQLASMLQPYDVVLFANDLPDNYSDWR